MILLALDTATPTCGIGLFDDDKLVCRSEAEIPASNETLLPNIVALLERAGLPLDRIEAYALAIGPGSFSGLRIGLATVKGLAFQQEIPVAGVSSLAAMALQVGKRDTSVVATLDAGRGELYAGAFRLLASGFSAAEGGAKRWQLDGVELEPDTGLPEGIYEVEALLAKSPRPGVIVGPGASRHAELIQPGLDAGLGLLREPAGSILDGVAALGLAQLRSGEGCSAGALVPRYLRQPAAVSSLTL